MRRTVIPPAVALGNDEIFPSFFKLGVANFLDVDGVFIKDVSALEISGVDNSGETHDPVGNACEILEKGKVGLELVVGSASCIGTSVRGIDRNREVIIMFKQILYSLCRGVDRGRQTIYRSELACKD